MEHEDVHEDGHDDEHEDEMLEGEHEEEEQKGTLANSDTDSFGIKGGLTHIWDQGFLGIAVRHSGSEYGIPGGHSHHGEEEHMEGEASHADEAVRIDLEQTRVESRGAVHIHEGMLDSVKFGMSYSDYKH
jgi:iron complex outermembrane receptor protein